MTEADVEQAALAWLEGLGWRVAHSACATVKRVCGKRSLPKGLI